MLLCQTDIQTDAFDEDRCSSACCEWHLLPLAAALGGYKPCVWSLPNPLARPFPNKSITKMNVVENPSALEPVPDDYPGLKKGEVSTGTTIMAIPFKDGVVLGADSRVSTGSYVANRVSDKIVQLSEHIFACRSGSAADTQALTDYVRFYLQQLS